MNKHIMNRQPLTETENELIDLLTNLNPETVKVVIKNQSPYPINLSGNVPLKGKAETDKVSAQAIVKAIQSNDRSLRAPLAVGGLKIRVVSVKSLPVKKSQTKKKVVEPEPVAPDEPRATGGTEPQVVAEDPAPTPEPPAIDPTPTPEPPVVAEDPAPAPAVKKTPAKKAARKTPAKKTAKKKSSKKLEL